MNDETKFNLVKASRDKAYVGARYIRQGKLKDFGELLHHAWMDKKAVEKSITNSYFDEIYDRALAAGALGGKLLGAGGGGFFLFYVEPKHRSNVIDAITQETQCRIYDFKFTEYGSRITSHC
jgi:D-glycero-alpha-D-manno-heptose-7-phosphate kinase